MPSPIASTAMNAGHKNRNEPPAATRCCPTTAYQLRSPTSAFRAAGSTRCSPAFYCFGERSPSAAARRLGTTHCSTSPRGPLERSMRAAQLPGGGSLLIRNEENRTVYWQADLGMKQRAFHQEVVGAVQHIDNYGEVGSSGQSAWLMRLPRIGNINHSAALHQPNGSWKQCRN